MDNVNILIRSQTFLVLRDSQNYWESCIMTKKQSLSHCNIPVLLIVFMNQPSFITICILGNINDAIVASFACLFCLKWWWLGFLNAVLNITHSLSIIVQFAKFYDFFCHFPHVASCVCRIFSFALLCKISIHSMFTFVLTCESISMFDLFIFQYIFTSEQHYVLWSVLYLSVL